MKHLLTIAFISTCLFSFGQTSQMFWNNYANFNPAMSGFQYQQHASATYTDYYPALSGGYKSVFADYGMNIADHHGIGINYTGDFSTIGSHKVLLNYNYQLDLNGAGDLSIGTGMGIGQTTIDYDKLTFGNLSVLPEPTTSFEFNLGIAYNWERLYVGFSATNLAQHEQNLINPYYVGTKAYHAHAEYIMPITRRLNITPRLMYLYQNGYQEIKSNITATYKQCSLGISSTLRNDFGVNIGWDIKNKLRVAYMFSKRFSNLNYNSGGIHEFSIGYLIKNKPSISHFSGTPAF